MLRVSESCKNAIVCENGGQVWGARMRREEKMPKRDRRMQRLCKTCQNATVKCRDWAKPAKMRPLNAASERKQQKYDHTRERGAGAAWENAEWKSCQTATVEWCDLAKAAKMSPSNTVSVRKLQNCVRRMRRVSEGWNNAIVWKNKGEGRRG